jgi:glycogen synthase
MRLTDAMRLLLTTDAVGGAWTFALALTESLRPRGVSIALACMGPRPSAVQREAARFAGVTELRECDFRLEWMEDPWADVDAAGEWLLAMASDVGPDAVHVNGFAQAALDWPVPVVLGVHSCVQSWWRAVHGVPAPAAWGEYRRRVRSALDAAELVVFPTASFRRAVQAEHGPVANGRVIHNGARGVQRHAGKEPLVLAAGRFDDAGKNLSVLEAVASQITWPLAVAGRATDRVTQCQSLGYVESAAIRDWQARASIAIHPARYEPFGYVPLEAALAGCALVLSDIPTLRELWDGAALFARPDDAEGLARAVQRLIDQPDARAEVSARAGERARQYSLDAMGESYLAAYRSVIAARAGEVTCAS